MIEGIENLDGNISSARNVDGSVSGTGTVNGNTLAVGEKYMTYVDLSTDMENPTDIMQFISKSGTYVAKNKGFIGYNGEVITVLGRGMFFKIYNLKDLYEIAGEILPDEDNVISLIIPSINGGIDEIYIMANGDIAQAISINSLNIEEYIPDIDASQFVERQYISNSNGVQMSNSYLTIFQASNSDINNGTNRYRPITPNNGDYFIEKRGTKYFPTKEDLAAVQTSVNTLISEIESVLDTVVVVNE